ncbi:helix-turn-helix domain-containing protein [Mycolicibacter heraklionensis]|uniref:helix-turn-helix domain-containing protein n=1 Tax=Mycolicibacter heraklionensis TaxID=512402 RepID=UPI002E153320|nr:helix-turn-helix domain-containing protein [Mycolicibacter heraklionensis]
MHTYRLRPQVIDRARDRHNCSSDEQLAVKLGMASGTLARIRRGDNPSFVTAIRLLEAADMPLSGIQRIPAADTRQSA